jgi:pSer/pThr/pTyr-binding forkhead associated (FHA) protein
VSTGRTVFRKPKRESSTFSRITAASSSYPSLTVTLTGDRTGTRPAGTVAAPTTARLVRDSGAELDGELTGLGRGPENNVVIPDNRVSRRHALIQREGNRYMIDDLDSLNGTWVNGERISSRRELKSGDTLYIGHTQFTFQTVADASVTGMLRSLDKPEEVRPGEITGMLRALDEPDWES